MKKKDILTKRSGKKAGKTLLATICWLAGIWAVILVIVQIVLSPAFLTKTVTAIADDFIDGELKFGKVTASVFRHFPNVSMTLDSVSLTYPSERFAVLDSTGIQSRLLRRGRGPGTDTLASFDRFTISVNVMALIGGELRIPYAEMRKPRIFAKNYNDSTANWNIFRTAGEDDGSPSEEGSGFSLSGIVLGKISLEENPLLVYCDKKDSLFASLRLKQMYIQRHNDNYGVKLEARTGVSMPAIGRVTIPIETSATVSFPKDSVPSINVSGLEGSVAGIPLTASGSAKYYRDSLALDVRASIEGCRIEDVLAHLKKSSLKSAVLYKTDARLNLEAMLKGSYAFNGSRLPEMNLSLDIPDATVVNGEIGMNAKVGTEISAEGGGNRPLNVNVRKMYFDGEAIYMSLRGKALDIAGRDPVFDIDGELATSLDTIATYLPPETGIEMKGDIRARATGKIRLSQIDPYKFYGADLTGFIRSDRLRVRMPKDSLTAALDSVDITLATVGNTRDKDVEEGMRMLAVVAKVHKAAAEYRNSFNLEGENLALKAQNDASVIDTRHTEGFHPFGGQLEIGGLTLTDSDSCSVSLSKSDNLFKISPDPDRPGNPRIMLKSNTGAVRVNGANDNIFTRGLYLNITASKRTEADRSKRVKAWMDSLSKVYPEVPRDSLPSFVRKMRTSGGVPEWLSDNDFRAKDPKFKLDEAIAGYYKEWNFDGAMNIGRTVVRTPHFPLNTVISTFSGNINNNEIAIRQFKVRSGTSDLAVSGSLTGLRRALLRNGTVSLGLNINSKKLNVNELLKAYSYGAQYRESVGNPELHGYEQVEVMDSIDDTTQTSSPLVIIPSNINAEINVSAGEVKYSKMNMGRMQASLIMKERCLQLKKIEAKSNVGNIFIEGFYSTQSKKNLKTGFNLSLTDVTAEKIVEMIPAVDTLMPMLKSFKGLLNCDIAATSGIDTLMNLVIPTLNGVVKIRGKNLALIESEDLFKIARTLKFKDIHNIRIDDMAVEGIISDSHLEVFPFVMSVDRYSLAMSGIQNLDQSFRYHVSILKSPLVIRFGVDFWGSDFDHLKFKIGKAKYKNKNVPVFTSVVDETRLNLSRAIRNIFTKGVENAIRENEKQEAVRKLKKELDYTNAATTGIEELSTEEASQLENNVQGPSAQDTNGTAQQTGEDASRKTNIDNQ